MEKNRENHATMLKNLSRILASGLSGICASLRDVNAAL